MTQKRPRVFMYNGMELADLDPTAEKDAIKDLWAVTYPDLNNAAITGPEVKDGKDVYKFSRAVGAKG